MKISWANIYEQQSSKLLGLCRRYVNDLQVAEDILHDAFTTAMQKQHQFKGKGSVEAWLRTITVNTALMYLRQRKDWQVWEEGLEESTTETTIHDAVDEKRTIQLANFQAQDLLAAIDEIPSHHRAVFNLYVFEEYKHKQIAQLLNISVGTSKSHLARARKNIQKILYLKAVEMKKKKRPVLFAFSWLYLKPPQETHFIDELFQEKLSHFELPATPPQDAAFQTLAFSSRLQVGISLKTLVLLVSIGSVVAISSVVYLRSVPDTNFNSTKAPEQENTIIPLDSFSMKPTSNNSTDTITLDTPPIKPPKQKKPIISPPLKEPNTGIKDTPIVVHKQVIVRDTVFKVKEGNEH
ncbi:MAG: RNA polymerase sigma factor [Bacteroidota bacterium]